MGVKARGNAPTPIDFAAVARSADLRTLVEAVCGPPDRSGRYHCPLHDDASPSLYLWDGDRRFRCWPCQAQGDAIDFIAWVDNIGVAEAARRLDPTLDRPAGRRGGAAPSTPPPTPPPEPPPAWQAADWQAAVDELIGRAEEALWSPAGRRVVAWLAARKIDPETARRFRLGYLPSKGWTRRVSWPDGAVGGIWHARGVLIPWVAPGECYDPRVPADGPRWVGANVRQLAADPFAPLPDKVPRYLALTGGERGFLYPWPTLLPTQGRPPAVLAEGELDALLGFQEAGPLAFVGTIGGAAQSPHRSAQAALARCPWWLVATDHDESGVKAALRWRQAAPHKARRVLLPVGKDLTDFAEAEGDIRGWLAGELARVTKQPTAPETPEEAVTCPA